jgi:hypothetical protein
MARGGGHEHVGDVVEVGELVRCGVEDEVHVAVTVKLLAGRGQIRVVDDVARDDDAEVGKEQAGLQAHPEQPVEILVGLSPPREQEHRSRPDPGSSPSAGARPKQPVVDAVGLPHRGADAVRPVDRRRRGRAEEDPVAGPREAPVESRRADVVPSARVEVGEDGHGSREPVRPQQRRPEEPSGSFEHDRRQAQELGHRRAQAVERGKRLRMRLVQGRRVAGNPDVQVKVLAEPSCFDAVVGRLEREVADGRHGRTACVYAPPYCCSIRGGSPSCSPIA